MLSLEHIDPKTSKFICGLENPFNEIWVDISYNARKTNRFVPYRVQQKKSPVNFGDMAEFLIDGEWVVCEFGGEIWWEESNRLGNSCVDGGRIRGKKCLDSKTGMFSPTYTESPKYIEDRRAIGKRRVSQQSGIFDPDYINSSKFREDKSKGGKSGSKESKKLAGKLGGAATSKLISKTIRITFPDGLQKEYESSVAAATELEVNSLTLRRLAESGKTGVKKKYKGLKVDFL